MDTLNFSVLCWDGTRVCVQSEEKDHGCQLSRQTLNRTQVIFVWFRKLFRRLLIEILHWNRDMQGSMINLHLQMGKIFVSWYMKCALVKSLISHKFMGYSSKICT